MNCYKEYILTLLLVLIFSNICEAQFNLKIGFLAGYTNPKINNSIIQAFDSSPDFLDENNENWLEKRLRKIYFTQGIEVGFRYKTQFVGFEFTWYNRSRKIRSEGPVPDTRRDFSRNLHYRFVTYSPALELYFSENIGIGASYDLDNLIVKTKHSGRGDNYIAVKNSAYSSHFYLLFNFQTAESLSVSFKPYVQYYWTKHDLRGLQEDIEQYSTSDLPLDDFNEDFMSIGLQVIFYNGRQ